MDRRSSREADVGVFTDEKSPKSVAQIEAENSPHLLAPRFSWSAFLRRNCVPKENRDDVGQVVATVLYSNSCLEWDKQSTNHISVKLYLRQVDEMGQCKKECTQHFPAKVFQWGFQSTHTNRRMSC